MPGDLTDADPDLVEAHANLWLHEAERLGQLASIVEWASTAVAWSGQGHFAQYKAAHVVAAEVRKTAGALTEHANQLLEYAKDLRHQKDKQHTMALAFI